MGNGDGFKGIRKERGYVNGGNGRWWVERDETYSTSPKKGHTKTYSKKTKKSTGQGESGAICEVKSSTKKM